MNAGKGTVVFWFKQEFITVQNKDTVRTSWAHQQACILFSLGKNVRQVREVIRQMHVPCTTVVVTLPARPLIY